MGNNKKQSGFTIVELLIVVVVIAILAAITIVAYTGIQNRAKQSAAQQLLTQANQKVLAYAALNSDLYPPDLATAGLTNTDGLQYSYNNSVTPHTYGITATSGTYSYYMSDTVTSPTSGGYAGHGVGGVAAITNMAVNPSFEVSAAGQNAYNSTLATSSLWSQSGTNSIRITPTSSSSSDSFDAPGGDLGGLRLGMQAGHTYTISGTIRLAAAQTGGLSGAARKLTAWYTDSGGTNTQVASAAAPNAAGATQLSVTFTVPAGATGAWIRLYDGAMSGGGDVWWDAIMLTDGSAQPNYADGSSPNWVWNGTAGLSTSTGPAL